MLAVLSQVRARLVRGLFGDDRLWLRSGNGIGSGIGPREPCSVITATKCWTSHFRRIGEQDITSAH